MRHLIATSLLLTGISSGSVDHWKSIDPLLDSLIKTGAFPGCVGLAGDSSGILFNKAAGTFTDGSVLAPLTYDNPKVQTNTLYDMASLTKVLMATTATMTFFQRGEIQIDAPVSNYLGTEFNSAGKQEVKIENLLLHNSGFGPDPNPGYWEKSFGCPETLKGNPRENFSCRDKIWKSLMNQELVNPVGSKYVYSDLSMITMMFVLGRLAQNLNYIHSEELNPLCVAGGKIGIEQCYYEAYVKKYIIDYVGMQDSFFNLSPENMKRAAPTPWTFLEYRDNAQGQVQDDNAYAMGGVSGHAGLFSTASDAFKLLQKLVFASNNDPWINSSTVHYFTTMRNSSQSARALGWDTNDYTARGYGGCGNLSPRTFMHTGYAGTQVCCDPDRKLIVVLLTNSNGTNSEMLNARRDFSDQVLKLWESK